MIHIRSKTKLPGKKIIDPFAAEGFTLLEVLVALSIFSLIALGGFRLLNTTAAVTEAGQITSEKNRAYKKASSVIANDLRNAINRPMPSANPDTPDLPAFFTDRNFMLEFSRGAYGPGTGATRSDAVRIRYLLRESDESDQTNRFDLIRQLSAMDGEQRGVQREQLLLHNVEIATVRFMDAKDAWHNQWPVTKDPKQSGVDALEQPQDSAASVIPKAVELDIKTSISTGPILVSVRT